MPGIKVTYEISINGAEDEMSIPYAYVMNDVILIGPPGLLTPIGVNEIDKYSIPIDKVDHLLELAHDDVITFITTVDASPMPKRLYNEMIAIKLFALQPRGDVIARLHNHSQFAEHELNPVIILPATLDKSGLFTTVPIPPKLITSDTQSLYKLFIGLRTIHHAGFIHARLSHGIVNDHIDVCYARFNLSMGLTFLKVPVMALCQFIMNSHGPAAATIGDDLPFMKCYRFATLFDILSVAVIYAPEFGKLIVADIPLIYKKVFDSAAATEPFYPIDYVIDKFKVL